MPEKDVFWSHCLDLKETKIRRPQRPKSRDEMEVLWTLLSNFQTFSVRPNTVAMCVTALTVVTLLLIVDTLPACWSTSKEYVNRSGRNDILVLKLTWGGLKPFLTQTQMFPIGQVLNLVPTSHDIPENESQSTWLPKPHLCLIRVGVWRMRTMDASATIQSTRHMTSFRLKALVSG